MSWSYNSSALGSTVSSVANLMQVRFLVGDVSSSTQLVQDEEITWVLSQYSNIYEASAITARSIATHFSKLAATKSVGQLSLTYSQRSQYFLDLSKALAGTAMSPTVRSFVPYAGGISIADKTLQRQDSDWSQPSFGRGMHDISGQVTDWVSNMPST